MAVVLKNLVGLLSEPAKQALERGVGMCLSRAHQEVRPEHWLAAIFDDSDTDVPLICREFGVDAQGVRRYLEASLAELGSGHQRTPTLSIELVTLMTDAWLIASINLGARTIRTGSVLLAVLQTPSLRVRQQLISIDEERLASKFDAITTGSNEALQPRSTATRLKRPISSRADARLRVFVSYRRNDTATAANLIASRLQLAGLYVFQDIDTMPPGAIFTDAIRATLEESDVVVALIGRKWVGDTDRGGRRLDDAEDWVRIEIATALRLNKLVIPCLIGTTRFPTAGDLPEDVRPITSRNAVRISPRNIQRDIVPLLNVLNRVSVDEE